MADSRGTDGNWFMSPRGWFFSQNTGQDDGKVSNGECFTEPSSSIAGKDSGHHCGPTELIREAITHETEPIIPGTLGWEGEGSQEGNGD